MFFLAAGRKGKKRKNRLGVLAIGTVALILMAVSAGAALHIGGKKKR